MGSSRLTIRGVGLHSGETCTVTLGFGRPHSGVEFHIKQDGKDAAVIPASISHVVRSRRATTLGRDGVEIGMVEHLLSALAALGVKDIVIGVEGPEIPVLDGSSAHWALAIKALGAAREPKWIKWPRSVCLESDKVMVRIEPDDHFSIDATIEFPEKCIGLEQMHWHFNRDGYLPDIAPARTLGRMCEVDLLRREGLIRGASPGCALVASENGFINPEGARFADEPVRHRILDAIGDIFLKTAPALPLARVTLVRAGHSHLLSALSQL